MSQADYDSNGKTSGFVRDTLHRLGNDSKRCSGASDVLPARPYSRQNVDEPGRSAAGTPDHTQLSDILLHKFDGRSDIALPGEARETPSPRSGTLSRPSHFREKHYSIPARPASFDVRSKYSATPDVQREGLKTAVTAHFERCRDELSVELRGQLTDVEAALKKADVAGFGQELTLLREREIASQKECQHLREHCEQLLLINSTLRQNQIGVIVNDLSRQVEILASDVKKIREMHKFHGEVIERTELCASCFEEAAGPIRDLPETLRQQNEELVFNIVNEVKQAVECTQQPMKDELSRLHDKTTRVLTVVTEGKEHIHHSVQEFKKSREALEMQVDVLHQQLTENTTRVEANTKRSEENAKRSAENQKMVTANQKQITANAMKVLKNQARSEEAMAILEEERLEREMENLRQRFKASQEERELMMFNCGMDDATEEEWSNRDVLLTAIQNGLKVGRSTSCAGWDHFVGVLNEIVGTLPTDPELGPQAPSFASQMNMMMPQSFMSDREFVLAAARVNGRVLESVTSLDLWSDRDVVLMALRAPDGLQLGRVRAYGEDFAERVGGRIVGIPFESLGAGDICDTMGCIPPHFLSDREVVLAAINGNGMLLEFLSEDFRSDFNVVNAAALKSGTAALAFASSELQEDDRILRAAAKSGEAWRSPSPDSSSGRGTRKTTGFSGKSRSTTATSPISTVPISRPSRQ